MKRSRLGEDGENEVQRSGIGGEVGEREEKGFNGGMNRGNRSRGV